MITPSKELFQWIYDRLVNVHKENPNVDYMILFKECIEELSFKDALLKWLDGKMTMEGATEGFIGGYDAALKDVIDKINSM